MSERFCWNCGHSQDLHAREEGCSFRRGEGDERCDCPRYEDGDYLGENRKRDLYTLSDRRRLTQGRRPR